MPESMQRPAQARVFHVAQARIPRRRGRARAPGAPQGHTRRRQGPACARSAVRASTRARRTVRASRRARRAPVASTLAARARRSAATAHCTSTRIQQAAPSAKHVSTRIHRLVFIQAPIRVKIIPGHTAHGPPGATQCRTVVLYMFLPTFSINATQPTIVGQYVVKPAVVGGSDHGTNNGWDLCTSVLSNCAVIYRKTFLLSDEPNGVCLAVKPCVSEMIKLAFFLGKRENPSTPARAVKTAPCPAYLSRGRT